MLHLGESCQNACRARPDFTGSPVCHEALAPRPPLFPSPLLLLPFSPLPAPFPEPLDEARGAFAWCFGLEPFEEALEFADTLLPRVEELLLRVVLGCLLVLLPLQLPAGGFEPLFPELALEGALVFPLELGLAWLGLGLAWLSLAQHSWP